jgi:E3 ubiquitin-protein ligase HUWE1
MFNPDNALFTLSVEGNRMQPNPYVPLTLWTRDLTMLYVNRLSDINPDHLSYFRMIGRVLGLAITNDELINVHFTRGVYKHVLDIKPNLDDLYSVDATYHKNLK